jgi:hypothetical protein
MERFTKNVLCCILLLISASAKAQSQVEMADGMRAEGKIYVVVAIILIILTGFILYLAILDRKVKKLENLLADKNRPGK